MLYKKLSKKEIKLKSKPWISIEIQSLMKKRDKLLTKFLKHKMKNSLLAAKYNGYKIIRNNITKMKWDNKMDYYKRFFDSNKNKMSTIWKGIRSIVSINNTSKKDIKILDKNGKKITEPQKIVNLFNNHYSNVGPNIDKKLPKRNLQVEKSFCLKPVVKQEIFDLILAFDNKKSLSPNSIPIYILKISNHLFSDLLTEMVNLSFKTGIFPALCKLSKIIPIFKKDPMFCVNYRPISLLPIYSKIFEKLIYTRMYSFLTCNNLNDKQFGFRAKHSVNHALISITELIKITTRTW